MKNLKILFLIMIALSINTMMLKAQCGGDDSKTTSMLNKNQNNAISNDSLQSIKVDGNCEMCKSRIEKAALGVKGVKTASWDIQSHLLTFNLSQETKLEDVSLAVANAGHDNEKAKATDKVFNALPMCCKYRK